MWSLPNRKHSRQAVFIHDGQTWYGRVFIWKKNKWECIDGISYKSTYADDLASDLLSLAQRNSVDRVRILIPGEVYSVHVKLPDDVEPDEINTVLSYEVAGETGMEAHMFRLAAVRAVQYQMGGDEDTLLSSVFDISLVDRYEKSCQREGMVLDGIGSLELGSLNYHARQNIANRLLLLRKHNGFYVTGNNEQVPFGVHAISFGCEPVSNGALEEERLYRMARQFQHSNSPVHIWHTQAIDDSCREKLIELFGEHVSLDFEDFESMVTAIATHAAWQSTVGRINCGCAIAEIHKKQPAPYRAGAWICLIILLMSVFYIGLRWHSFKYDLAAAKQRQIEWKQVTDERQKLNNQIGQLKEQQAGLIQIESLNRSQVISPCLETILECLGRQMPPYTRINSVVQMADDRYEIKGTTRYSDGLIQLNQVLSAAMREYKLVVEPGQVKQEGSGSISDINLQEKTFIYRVIRQGGSN